MYMAFVIAVVGGLFVLRASPLRVAGVLQITKPKTCQTHSKSYASQRVLQLTSFLV
jgi:hypothetical protein